MKSHSNWCSKVSLCMKISLLVFMCVVLYVWVTLSRQGEQLDSCYFIKILKVCIVIVPILKQNFRQSVNYSLKICNCYIHWILTHWVYGKCLMTDFCIRWITYMTDFCVQRSVFHCLEKVTVN